MPTTSFDPVEHGFAFPNDFVNVIGTLPGFGKITTYGRCGGMAYASLDYYHHGLRVPENADLPPDGTVLADYIYRRLLDSYLVASASKFISWTLYSDDPTWFYKGVTRWTKEDEFPRMAAGIDRGFPQVLGLVIATDLAKIGNDHQVVAYGYDDDGSGNLSVDLYDNRYPGGPARLWSAPDRPHWTLSHDGVDEDWRGFFVHGYSQKMPEHLADGTLLAEKGAPEVCVVYGGAKFRIPGPVEMQALGFSTTDVQTVSDGSTSWVADIPADGTLLRERSGSDAYAIAGAKRHRIASPEAFDARGYSRDDVGVVPDGGLAGIPGGEDFGVPAAPAPSHPWSHRNAGRFRTPDGDEIRYEVDRQAVPPDLVEFELSLGPGVSGRKVLSIADAAGGSRDVVVPGPGGSAKDGLRSDRVASGSLTFRKTKRGGATTDVHALRDLDGLTPGSRVTFTWVQDRPNDGSEESGHG